LAVIIFSGPSYGQKQPLSPLVNSFKEYNSMKSSTHFGLDWISLGPVLNSARVESVQVDPDNEDIMYVAFGSGNLWKTTNHGLTWKPIFNDVPAQGIGDIALAPSNPDILYVGTGESLKKPRNFTMPGTGIYRSDNGGLTWRHLGLDDSWHISEVAVDPENPDIVLVAVLGHFWTPNIHRGLYRTADGGKTWSQVLYLDDRTGANDVVFAPSDPDIVYASLWENYPDVYGAKSSIWKSMDGGISWKKEDNGIPETINRGRIGLAVSYSNPNKVYALMDNRNKPKPILAAEIYRTLDGGNSWAKTHKEDGLMFLSVIGWYFADIYVNPGDDKEIFALGVKLAHSHDGGKSFDYLDGEVHHFNPSPAQTLHLDMCELWISPKQPDHLVLGNDGGIYTSTDKGNSWMHYNNIPAGEFYDIALDQRQPYRIYGGTQDDATVYGPGREWDPPFADDWHYLWIDAWSGGDGCQTYVDPVDPNTIYFSAQHGAIRKMDLAADTSSAIRPSQLKDTKHYSTNFVAPYFLSSHDPKALYLGANHVFYSADQGEKWKIISPDLAITADTMRQSTALGALVESPGKEGILYAGTDHGGFWVTHDNGVHWNEHSTGLPKAYIRSICPSGYRQGRVYIALSGMNYDDLGAHLFRSEDEGEHWISIRANLPNEVTNVILEDPRDEEFLYVGTLRGVYVSMDRGGSWSLLGKGLPAVAVADLAIDSTSLDLIVATHGRGIYRINLTPIHELKQLNRQKDHLLAIPTAHRPWFRNTHGDVDRKSATKLPITFWANKSESVTLSLHTVKDSLIWSKPVRASTGLNQFRWDMVTRKARGSHPYFIHNKEYLPAGSYILTLTTSEGSYRQPLKVEEYDE